MKMTFDVTYQDGRTVTAVAMPKDFVAFERQYGKAVSTFGSDSPIEWIYYLAWAALHRMRDERADFDGFLDVVEDVTPQGDEAEAVDESAPFPPAASPDSSA